MPIDRVFYGMGGGWVLFYYLLFKKNKQVIHLLFLSLNATIVH